MSYSTVGFVFSVSVMVPVEAYAPPKKMIRSNRGREYMVPSMPAKRTVEELKNCLAVSYAFSVLKSEMMKSASKRSCNALRDWKRFSYSVT